jgi:hypothetical protein
MTFDDIARALTVSAKGSTAIQDAMNRAVGAAIPPAAEPDALSIQRMETATVRKQLAFREACAAVHVEGVLARQIGLPLDANPYHGNAPAERVSPGHRLGDFTFAWSLGWQEADEREAIDALIIAARAATREGRATPACPAGENLREAVEAYLGRRVITPTR